MPAGAGTVTTVQSGERAMLEEMSIDSFRFGCPGCGHAWTVDYDLRHVEDGHGITWDCYSRDGRPAATPTARGVVCCPRCGAGLVHVQLVASRVVPVVA